MPTPLRRLVQAIDTFTDWTGRLFAWLIIPLVGALVYEVLARYLFKAPTIWAFDVSYMLYGTFFMLGAAYALLKGSHIRTDLIYQNLPVRWQGTIDAVSYLVFFFPGVLFFLFAGWDFAMRSWAIQEVSNASPWRPVIYPFKTVIPIAIVLLLIQGISEFIKSVYAAVRGKRYA